ncbi:RxLR effector protein, partial [Phytophthora megakarya]
MRLQVILLLALVAMFSGCAPATARSNRDDASTKGFLRTDDDNGEERAVKFDGLAKLFKPPLTPVERRAAELAKLAKMKDLTKAFKYLKLNKFKSVKVKELKLE